MQERMKILIGYDGSDCADQALAELRRAGLPRDAEVRVLSVAEAWMPPPPLSAYEIIEAATDLHSAAELQHRYAESSHAISGAHDLALRAGDRLRKDFPAWKVEADASVGSPSGELIARADDWEPDLIVVGTHGRTALGRFVLGSVSQKVLASARCSVRIARRQCARDNYPVRIIIGIDHSGDAKLAVGAVAERPWPSKSCVRLVTATEPFHMYGPQPGARAAQIRVLHSEAEARLRKAGLDVSSLIQEGDPKHVLIEAAQTWPADCIFLGARGHSFLERFFIGSVSNAVAARAPCSVEVTRAARD